MSGDEENRTPVQDIGIITYSSEEESLLSDLNRRPTVYKTVALSS
jgi:hypothetical protein